VIVRYIAGFGTLVNLSRKSFLGISYLVWIALVLVAITYVVLNFSNYGRRVYAVGGNRQAAGASGISVKKNIMTTYVIMGAFCGITGIMLSARTNSGQPNAAEQLHFDAITAAVIGDASMTGGIGNILSMLVGASTIACINNGMNLIGISSYYQLVIKGIIIIAAILIDKKSRDALFRQ
jgi:ribose/xylose/arabinose/galactoside ABC-type transport system permease subunit